MVIENSGLDLHPQRLEFIDGGLRPLGDRLVVKPLAVNLGSLIEATWHGKTLRAEVIAVGPGEYPNRYNSDRSRMWKSKQFLKTTVQVGDIIELGGMNYGGYTFPEIQLNGERCLIVSEKDVCGIRDA